MDCIGKDKSLATNNFVLLWVLFIGLVVAVTVTAGDDPFGQLDLISVDSVQAAPGQDVTVSVILQNDEILGSYSVPVKYDNSILELKSISFDNSRSQHIAYRIISPSDVAEIDGHFLVTLLKIYEDPIPAGEGPIFHLTFRVSDSAEVGQVALIDTLFFPPGGSLLLADDSLNYGIVPDFKSGMVVVREHNRAPEMTMIPDQYIIEGETLKLTLKATDPDGDDLILALTSKPTGSGFVDNGDGSSEFSWRPDYVGPYSADGSPYTIGFWATDGDLSVEQTISVNVINKNRKPQITYPSSVTIQAGEEVNFSISAIDPDFETVVWDITGLPAGANFDGGNPGSISWFSNVVDSGLFKVELVATDPHGFADTGEVSIEVQSASLYALMLDTVLAFPNETVLFDIMLENKLPISSFNLLINYDASALGLLDVTAIDSRSEQFEYFTVTLNENGSIGDVRIIGLADLTGAGVESLEAGEGAVATFEFIVSGQLSFIGLDIPVRFRFLDGFTKDDNTMTDVAEVKITQEEIVYADGVVRIRDYGQIKLGDINLNGLAFEISDAIYFTNYFMDPFLYTFDPLQFANSDVNQDNIAATVADLVTLINIVVSGSIRPKALIDNELTALVETELVDQRRQVSYTAENEIGGMLLTFHTDSELAWSDLEMLQPQMTYDFHQEGDQVRLLIYSMDESVMLAGNQAVVSFDNSLDIELENVDLASITGQMIGVDLGRVNDQLPETFVLHQNYPNPFNPETTISFALGEASKAELVLFNVLGRSIRTLINNELPAGEYEILWDGRNDNGNLVASGVYFYRLSTTQATQTRKMILLK